MKSTTIKSTSQSSAISDDIVLRETSTTRLIFRPMLVTNPQNQAAAVKGTFTSQRKGLSGAWEEVETFRLTKLKKHESVRLEIKSSTGSKYARPEVKKPSLWVPVIYRKDFGSGARS